MWSAERVQEEARGFPDDEFVQRLERAQRLLTAASLDAMLVTTEANFYYFTGFLSPFWYSPTRPMYLLVPREGRAPRAVLPEINAVGMARTWMGRVVEAADSNSRDGSSIRTWAAPRPEDDGVQMLMEEIRSLPRKFCRVGMPMGFETSLRMPLLDLDLVRADVEKCGLTLVDGTKCMQHIRLVKSELEIGKLRTVCGRVGRAMAELPAAVAAGRGPRSCKVAASAAAVARGELPVEAAELCYTERDLQREFRCEALRQGVDECPYVIAAVGGEHGYDSIVDHSSDAYLYPASRPFPGRAGHARPAAVLGVDTGCRFDGYYSDYTCNYSIQFGEEGSGAAGEPLRRAHESLWRCTEAAMELLRRRCVGETPEIFPADLFAEDAGDDAASAARWYGSGPGLNRHTPSALRADAAPPGPDYVGPLRMCDLWHAMNASLVKDGYPPSTIGRSGHGLGLELTEWPCCAPWDSTLLRPGMVITLEPSVGIAEVGAPHAGPSAGGILVHEENLVIRADGFELLSRRAPYAMDVLRLPRPPSPSGGERRAAGLSQVVELAPRRTSSENRFGAPPRVTFGFVQLPSDLLLEREAAGLLGQLPGICWRVQKMIFGGAATDEGAPRSNPELITTETFRSNASALRQAVRCFFPAHGYGAVDFVALACTSMSVALGVSKVQAELEAGISELRRSLQVDGATNDVSQQTPVLPCQTADMASGVWQALDDLRTRYCPGRALRVALLTPYVDEVHRRVVEFLEADSPSACFAAPPSPAEAAQRSFEVVAERNFGCLTDSLTTSLEPEYVMEEAVELCLKQRSDDGSTGELRDDVDVVFLSCSAMRTTHYGFVDDLERRLGGRIPVVTSTQALLYHCLRKCGKVSTQELRTLRGYGKLFLDAR